ncbi:hypothetical protein [Tsukamurella strandjordii]|uniref:Uncharacterized protein n=1 Tax=Tsukamurella strandjordii TaxID=147577 RepID=A0AA90SN08_9ACTN|nr:hypothetical protein [Tsukamurella strandjordii]MDP0399848.1 hypothetical protein [Tsukamurella strandjordii]
MSLYLFELDGVPAPASAARFVLAGLLDQHSPQSRYRFEQSASNSVACDGCAVRYPCPTVLGAALTTRFPLGLNPEDLAREMQRTSLGLPADAVIEDGLIVLPDTDGVYTWRRNESGQWTKSWVGKGGEGEWLTGEDDAMLAVLMTLGKRRGQPFGWRVLEDDLAVARAAHGHGRAWWRDESMRPYIADLPNPLEPN